MSQVTRSDAFVLASIRQHSRSFSLAQRLLPGAARLPAAVVYAWCRRADDAVDELPEREARRALERLESELDSVYAGARQDQPLLLAFQEVVTRFEIPETYPRDLLRGMRMDLEGAKYRSLADLYLYCYRVAGTVGLMMSHVLGVRHPEALKHAAHLGMAMQLTNICRDVVEDWQRRRLYLPSSLLPRGACVGHPVLSLPLEHQRAFAGAVRRLLGEADRLYASGDAGLKYLPLQSAWAVYLARLVYSRIGVALRGWRYDVTRGRARVSTRVMVWLVIRASFWSAAMALSPRYRETKSPATLPPLRYPADVLPL